MSFGGQLQLKQATSMKKKLMFRVQSKNIYQGLAQNFGNKKSPAGLPSRYCLEHDLPTSLELPKAWAFNLSYKSLGPGSRYKLGCNPYKWPKIMGLAEKFGGILGEFFQQKSSDDFSGIIFMPKSFLIILQNSNLSEMRSKKLSFMRAL